MLWKNSRYSRSKTSICSVWHVFVCIFRSSRRETLYELSKIFEARQKVVETEIETREGLSLRWSKRKRTGRLSWQVTISVVAGRHSILPEFLVHSCKHFNFNFNVNFNFNHSGAFNSEKGSRAHRHRICQSTATAPWRPWSSAYSQRAAATAPPRTVEKRARCCSRKRAPAKRRAVLFGKQPHPYKLRKGSHDRVAHTIAIIDWGVFDVDLVTKCTVFSTVFDVYHPPRR